MNYQDGGKSMTHRESKVSPGRVAQTSTYDGATHNVIQVANDDLLLVYTENDDHHHSPDGRIALRRSRDSGRTWSESRAIHNEPRRDATSPSLIYFPDHTRTVVLDTSFDVEEPDSHTTEPAKENYDTCLIQSTDNGHSWDDPVSIRDDLICDVGIPFGGGVEVEGRVMTVLGSLEGEVEVMFSDDGTSWTDNRLVTTSPDGRQFTEPVPCKVTENKLLIFGRESATGDFFAVRSSDGGETWSDPVFFNPTGSASPKPIWMKKTGPNELTGVWGDRDDQYIYSVSVSAHLAWQDPTELESVPRKRLHRQIGQSNSASYWEGAAGDFGYPTFVQLGPNTSDILLMFYDESPRPNIWKMYLY